MSLVQRLLPISIVFCIVSSALPAFSITLDEFNGLHQVTSSNQGAASSSAASSPQVVGGSRTLFAEMTGIAAGLSGTLDVAVQSGSLSHSQSSTVRGNSGVLWDGDLNASNLNPIGLGGIDLTQDGATAMQLEVISFDLPGGLPVSVRIRVYDASDVSGNTYSQGTILVDQVVASTTAFFLPFSAMTIQGQGGGADFTNIGAVTLEVIGVNPNIDLTLEWVGTNGDCRQVPMSNGSVFDECGICGGDNSSCSDCNGVPNGADVEGAVCNTGLPGVCENGTYDAQCVCVGTFDPAPEFCDGVDNDCDGGVDEQYPLLGSSCGAGEGDCKISGNYVCGDDGQITCDADFDLADFENCSEIIGCDGIPGSGLSYDECGICGGPGGDCSQCEAMDITVELFALDGNSKAQERLVRKITKQLLKLAETKNNVSYANSARSRARALHISNWGLAWSMPRLINQCAESVDCVSISNQSTLDIFRAQTDELEQLGIQAAKKLRRFNKNQKQFRRNARKARRLARKSLAAAALVPASHTQCS